MIVRFHRRSKSTLRNMAEHGWILIIMLVAIATIAIVMEAGVARSMAGEIRHDQEDELFRRGHQYERAIQLYWRRFGRYPTDLGQLENTNNIRFLRRRYQDPILRKNFKIIRFGQQHPKKNRNFGLPGAPSSQQPQQIGTSAASLGTLKLSDSPISDDVGPIVGVRSLSEKESFHELDDKIHYKDFEFWYDPTAVPPGGAQAGGFPAQPQGSQASPFANQPTNPTPRNPN